MLETKEPEREGFEAVENGRSSRKDESYEKSVLE